MARISGAELGQRLCKELGIDPGDYISIVIECNARNVSLITLKRIVRDNELRSVSEVLEEYNLVKKDESLDEKEWRLLVEDDCALPSGDEEGSKGA